MHLQISLLDMSNNERMNDDQRIDILFQQGEKRRRRSRVRTVESSPKMSLEAPSNCKIEFKHPPSLLSFIFCLVCSHASSNSLFFPSITSFSPSKHSFTCWGVKALRIIIHPQRQKGLIMIDYNRYNYHSRDGKERKEIQRKGSTFCSYISRNFSLSRSSCSQFSTSIRRIIIILKWMDFIRRWPGRFRIDFSLERKI